ncbi:MAG: hypothetical protein IT211_05135 [Armatimonadetes bacterium]|nr:hypothetical protein [Armatimonadota bacterium]
MRLSSSVCTQKRNRNLYLNQQRTKVLSCIANSKQQTANSKQQTANSKQQTANSNNPLLPILRTVICLMISILGITGISNGQEYIHPPCTQNPECTAQWQTRTASGNAGWFDQVCQGCTFTVEYRIRECPNCEIAIDKITYNNNCNCSTPYLKILVGSAIFVAISDPNRPEQCKPTLEKPCVENISVGMSSCWKMGQQSGIPDFSVGYSCASAENCCFAKYKVCFVDGNVAVTLLDNAMGVTCSLDPNDPNAPWMFGCDFSPCPYFPNHGPQQ